MVAITLGASLLLAACAPAADARVVARGQAGTPLSADVTKQLDAALTDAMTLADASGAIAGVWAPWAGEWLVSPGTTIRNGGTPLGTDMRFRVGTNTISMSCTVLLRLVDAGRVRLDDKVSAHLYLSAGVGGLNLGQLCQNTSGLADYHSELGSQFTTNPTREWPPLEIVSSGLGATGDQPAGGAWAQSNTGVVLLGLALQAATNQDWSSLYQQYIFDPLGMRDSSFPDSGALEIPGRHPHGYASSVGVDGRPDCGTILDETKLSNSMDWVSGGAVSTITDMRTWVQALAHGRLLSAASTDAQWATIRQGANAPSWQGYGLGAEQVGPLRGTGGAIPGFLSAAFSDPSSGLTVVVMLNNSSAGAGFVRMLALRLASIASTAPSTGGTKAPRLELPWSDQQTVAAMQAGAVCPRPAAPTR